MGLTLQEIINEADILVKNNYGIDQKVPWLNAINQEFFGVVKIPYNQMFTSTAGMQSYTLTGSIKEKDIDKVMIGYSPYLSLNYNDVQPGQSYFTYNETSKELTLSVPSTRSGLQGLVRYAQTATTSFLTSQVETQKPDAPEEYHWIYVLGLAEYIAKASSQDEKALNYGDQYRNALQVAAQNYRKEA